MEGLGIGVVRVVEGGCGEVKEWKRTKGEDQGQEVLSGGGATIVLSHETVCVGISNYSGAFSLMLSDIKSSRPENYKYYQAFHHLPRRTPGYFPQI